jgi:DNA-binding transcriptional MocR family regulator
MKSTRHSQTKPAIGDFSQIADAVAMKIASGALAVGERLPPQRTFAFEHGIAASTAGRVYGELLRRGLVVGEVGRGTFVSDRRVEARLGSELERHETRIDLDFNFPILPDQAARISASLANLHARGMDQALRPPTASMLAQARQVTAAHLTRGNFVPQPGNIAFTAGGRQAIAATISTLVPTGGRLGVEAITYPMVKSIAQRLGVTLVPIPVDAEGLDVAALVKSHQQHSLSAVYVQPALHNPLGTSLSGKRRTALAAFAKTTDVPLIEDHVYGFLGDAEPLALLAPEHCFVIDSLSKRIAPGLPLGFIIAPASMSAKLQSVVRGGGWSAAGYGIAAGCCLMADGTVAGIERDKRADAMVRQRHSKEILSGFDARADQRTYHTWLMLPPEWRADVFTAIAARHGVAVTPSSAFTVMPGHAPNAIRLALGAPRIDGLIEALHRLRRLLLSVPEAFAVSE